MQVIPGKGDPVFGYEAAGVVRRIGPNVSKLALGDRAVVIGTNTFATTVTAHEVYCEKLPDNVSLIEGACIPSVFMTAVYGLINLGRLSKGQVSRLPKGCRRSIDTNRRYSPFLSTVQLEASA